jgi:hypothetical protein
MPHATLARNIPPMSKTGLFNLLAHPLDQFRVR